jgi:predicted nucleic acid-binding protein
VSGTALVVDTNIFVSARNRGETGFAACRALLARIDRGEERAIVSALTLAELRAGFAEREVPTVWRPMMSHLLTSPNYHVEPLTASIADRAGELRARCRLRLADAVIVATGLESKASAVITQDREIRTKQSELPARPLFRGGGSPRGEIIGSGGVGPTWFPSHRRPFEPRRWSPSTAGRRPTRARGDSNP